MQVLIIRSRRAGPSAPSIAETLADTPAAHLGLGLTRIQFDRLWLHRGCLQSVFTFAAALPRLADASVAFRLYHGRDRPEFHHDAAAETAPDNSSARIVAAAVARMAQLTRLRLVNAEVPGAGAALIAEALMHLPCLACVQLNGSLLSARPRFAAALDAALPTVEWEY